MTVPDPGAKMTFGAATYGLGLVAPNAEMHRLAAGHIAVDDHLDDK